MTTPNSGRERRHRSGEASSTRKRYGRIILGVVLGLGLLVVAALRITNSGDSVAPGQPAETPIPELSVVLPKISGARAFYAAPDGLPTNDGSLTKPIDLGTVLSSTGPVAPGDTVWLRGGTYKGPFKSTLNGADDAPILVRQYEGERAVIDGASKGAPALTVEGSWTWYWGFEITDSGTQRVTTAEGTQPKDLMRARGIVATGSNVRFINLIVHDLAGGIYVDRGAANVDVYGNISYYNGWQSPTAQHGSGIDITLPANVVYIRDNVSFRQFGAGIQVVSSPDSNVLVEGNALFDNGDIGPQRNANLLMAGGHLHVINNHTFLAPGERRGGTNHLGYDSGCSSVEVRENHWVHPSGYPITLERCNGEIASNVFAGVMDDKLMTRYPNNSYTHNESPKGSKVVVRPNLYEPGRAHILVHNWNGMNGLRVNLADAGLTPGTPYEIHSVLNLFSQPVAEGVFDGNPLSLRLNTTVDAVPAVGVPTQPNSSDRTFSVFVVIPKAASTPPASPAARP